MDQQQHLYKRNAPILDSACCPSPNLRGPSGADWPHPHHIALRPKSPLSPIWSLVVLRHNYYFLCNFLVPGLWEHRGGVLVTWNGGPVFNALGLGEESTCSIWGHSWWCANVMLEGERCKEDTHKSGAAFTMPILGDAATYPRTMSRDCLEEVKTEQAVGEQQRGVSHQEPALGLAPWPAFI